MPGRLEHERNKRETRGELDKADRVSSVTQQERAAGATRPDLARPTTYHSLSAFRNPSREPGPGPGAEELELELATSPAGGQKLRC